MEKRVIREQVKFIETETVVVAHSESTQKSRNEEIMNEADPL